jgi:hypothetical protein
MSVTLMPQEPGTKRAGSMSVQRLGSRYEIGEMIGAGAMGEVYLGIDHHDGSTA